jgi:hypothetical protein
MREGQRFHSGKQHALVAPGVTGLVFTVDPNQVGKAIREMQLYLDRFQTIFDDEAQEMSDSGDDNNDSDQDQSTVTVDAPDVPTSSISSLLAAELAQFRKGDHSGEDGKPVARPPRVKKNQVMFSILETHCKGYLFVNVPYSPAAAVMNDRSELNSNHKRPREDDDAPLAPSGTEVSTSSTSRSFRVNDRVTKLVDALFKELEDHPTRPVSRFTYRMFPCSISCCPVSSSMTGAIKELASRIPPIPGRSAIKVGLHFNIKNNSNVEKEKNALRSELERCLPQSRFLMLPCGRKGIELDGVFQVNVLHSTCCVGYAPAYSIRKDYNIHDFGREEEVKTSA